MKRQIKMFLIIAIALLVVVFALLNIQSVAVNFGFGQLKLPMIVMLILWILVGALINFLLSTSSIFSNRRNSKKMTQEYNQKVSQLQVKINTLEKKLKNANQAKSDQTNKPE
ncbi:LapA family protein [Nicoliella lavandulae]|uniref:Lipopolysaccharide assembly protein LapA domain-containing protein n=1 Tax=Nicoliella lavandulae TaxID=3082954 RepID=A0ABU8SLF9_9LACO